MTMPNTVGRSATMVRRRNLWNTAFDRRYEIGDDSTTNRHVASMQYTRSVSNLIAFDPVCQKNDTKSGLEVCIGLKD